MSSTSGRVFSPSKERPSDRAPSDSQQGNGHGAGRHLRSERRRSCVTCLCRCGNRFLAGLRLLYSHTQIRGGSRDQKIEVRLLIHTFDEPSKNVNPTNGFHLLLIYLDMEHDNTSPFSPLTLPWLRRVSSVDQLIRTLCAILASYTGLPKRSATVCLGAGDAIGCG
jgi:hypothetical protein